MSHFATISNINILNKSAFIKAAEELGFKIEQNTTIKDWYGKTQNVDVALINNNTYDIGLIYNNEKENYSLVADFDMMNNKYLPEKVQQLQKNYSLGSILENYTSKHDLMEQYPNYYITEEINETGELTLEMEQY